MRTIILFLKSVFAVCLVLYGAAPIHAAPSEFSKQVTAITGDWEAYDFVGSDWKEGVIKIYPSIFDSSTNDYFLRISPDEPVAGRTLKAYFLDRYEGEDINGKVVDMRAPEMENDYSILKMHRWFPYNDPVISMWWAIKTNSGRFINAYGKCAQNGRNYSFDDCIDRTKKIIEALTNDRLKLPETAVPFNFSGWDGRYDKSGITTMLNYSKHREDNAILRASAPFTASEDQLRNIISNFSDQAVTDEDHADKDPGRVRWVGSDSDPWIRREFPKAWASVGDTGKFSIIMAGTVKTSDGKYVLVSVRAPHEGWQGIAADGVAQAKRDILAGEYDRKRLRLLAKAKPPLPVDGIKEAQVQAVYYKYSLGGNFGTEPRYNHFVFLKDGTVYDDFSQAFAEISIGKTKSESPSSWGRWTRVGNNISIKWGDGSDDKIPAGQNELMVGGTPATRLDGYYGNITVTGNWQTGSNTQSGYTFYPDGTFTSSRSSMFVASAYIPGSDSAGPTQVASGANSANSGRARYAINGYTMTLTYPDGTVERVTFAMQASEKDKAKPEAIFINGSRQELNLRT